MFGVALGMVLPMFWLHILAALPESWTVSEIARCVHAGFTAVVHYYFETAWGITYLVVLTVLFIWFRRPRVRKQY